MPIAVQNGCVMMENTMRNRTDEILKLAAKLQEEMIKKVSELSKTTSTKDKDKLIQELSDSASMFKSYMDDLANKKIRQPIG